MKVKPGTYGFYEIKMQGDSKVEIFIFDEIGRYGYSAANLIEDISGITGGRLDVYMHTPGGSVMDGLAIYNELIRLQAEKGVEVHTHGRGYVASMGTIIFLSAKKERRHMAENAFFMIHDPAIFGFTADDLKEWLADITEEFTGDISLLEMTKNAFLNIYDGASNLDRNTISGLMTAETWMTATEAQGYGFVHEVTEPIEAAAKIDDLKHFNFSNIPDNLAEELKRKKVTAAAGNNQNFLSVMSEIKNFFGEFLTGLKEAGYNVTGGKEKDAAEIQVDMAAIASGLDAKWDVTAKTPPPAAPTVETPKADNTGAINALKAGIASLEGLKEKPEDADSEALTGLKAELLKLETPTPEPAKVEGDQSAEFKALQEQFKALKAEIKGGAGAGADNGAGADGNMSFDVKGEDGKATDPAKLKQLGDIVAKIKEGEKNSGVPAMFG